MAMNKSTANRIQRLTILINSNICVAEDHPELKEKMGNNNKKLRAELEELKKQPIKNGRIVADSKKEDIVVGKCNALVGSTNKPCCNAEASGGYCLIHLKQRSPEIAEDFQRNRLSKMFGLTEEEIDKIKESNGTLENVGKGLSDYIKSQRMSQ